MKKFVCVLAALLGVAGSGSAFAADYLPVGPQTGVALSTVTGGGWSQCYSATMGTPFGNSASTALAGCTGDRLMLAGRETGSSTLLVLAQAFKADALFDTGAANNGIFHSANGSNWFYADNYSWGYLPDDQSSSKTQCITYNPNGSMCVHTFGDVGGYSINTITSLNGSSAYEKLVFQFAPAVGSVPEPATWAMMLVGFGMAGFGLRRRKSEVTTRVAFA